MQRPNRRQVVVGIGAIGIGTTGTILSTQDAEAVSVAMGEMTIPDKAHSGEISEIIADVDVEIDFEANNQPASNKFSCYLYLHIYVCLWLTG